MKVKVKVKKLHQNARMPEKKSEGAACFDLYATTVDNQGSGVWLVGTGLAFEIPPGFEGIIRGRSGMAAEGAVVHVGTIDSDYRGEVCVALHGEEPYVDEEGDLRSRKPRPGERIAQLAIRPVPVVEFEEVDSLSDTPRADFGFGSTGR